VFDLVDFSLGGKMSIKPGAGDYEQQDPAVQPQRQYPLEGQAKSNPLIQQCALWASIVMAAVAVATLLIGFWNSNRNAEAQLQLLALGTIQHYLDLAVEHPDLASHDYDQPIDAKYGWFAAHALTTAQTLWIMVGHQVDWQRSINAIIRQHQPYLRSGAFVCDDFAPEFVSYLKERVANLRCAELKGAE